MCKYCEVAEVTNVNNKEIVHYFGKDLLNSEIIVFTNDIYSLNAEMNLMGTSENPHLHFDVSEGLYKHEIVSKVIPIKYCPFCGEKLLKS